MVGGLRVLGSILAHIESLSNSFTKTDKRIAEYVKSNFSQVVYMSLTECADKINVSEGSIIRFCKKLGLEGFYELKITLATSTAVNGFKTVETKGLDDIKSIKWAMAKRNIQTIEDTTDLLSDSCLESSVDSIVQAGLILLAGVGASSIVAHEAFHRFMRIGLKCHYSADSHFQAMLAAQLSENDVLIAFSQSGSTVEVVDLAKITSKLGATIVAVTGYARSPLAKFAKYVLLTPTRENLLENVSTRSKIAQFHVLDIIFAGILRKIPTLAKENIIKTAEAVSNRSF